MKIFKECFVEKFIVFWASFLKNKFDCGILALFVVFVIFVFLIFVFRLLVFWNASILVSDASLLWQLRFILCVCSENIKFLCAGCSFYIRCDPTRSDVFCFYLSSGKTNICIVYT